MLNFGRETTHLKVISDKDKADLENQIIELIQAEPELTSYAIAKKLCPDESKFPSFKVKVTRIVNKYTQKK
jgi:hypothetical protein